MDAELTPSPQNPQHDEPKPNHQSPNLLRTTKRVLAIISLISILALSVFLAGLVSALLDETSSFTLPISLPSRCKIVSSGVDLRASKVCELGLLSHKFKHVFHPFEGSKVRCRYDYYWASVFEVEYIDHFLGHTQLGLAEAPNEALPVDCRPNFGAAWLTKDKFKVNETYGCWYTAGISKVSLNQEGLFSCHAKGSSTYETVRRHCMMSINGICSWFTRRGIARYWRWESFAGLIAGFLTSFLSSLFLIKVIQHIKSSLAKICTINTVRLKRACFLVAYFAVVGYLFVQYKKIIGVPSLSTLLF